jgi:aspartate kinase
MYSSLEKDTPIVQKYGGTSVGDPQKIKQVAHRIAKLHRIGYTRLAVVVSARSGVTNRIVERIKEINPNASGVAYDMALAAGEQETVGLLTAALEAEGIQGAPFLAFQAGIYTDGSHAKARIQEIKTEKIEKAWNDSKVVVIPGFQGISEDMEITTLGRGGSDTSAVALAVALKAGFCEINTDVDGVYTTDPRIVPQAKLIRTMDFEVALEMASLGSKVLHPRCVELGAKYGLPIVVRSSFQSDEQLRTVIMNEPESIESLVVSGVTLDRDVAKITVFGMPKGAGAVSKVFKKMSELNINVDIIIHNRLEDDPQMRLGFTAATGEIERIFEGIEQLKTEGLDGLGVSVEQGLAKVSAVGLGMRSYSGVAGRAFEALTSKGIDIHMISTSEIKISCVVRSADAEQATQALHKEFMEQSEI